MDHEHTYALAVLVVSTTAVIALAISLALRAHLARNEVYASIRWDLAEVRARHPHLHQPRPAVPSPGTPDGPQLAASARTRPPTGRVRRAVGLTASAIHVSPTASRAA